MSNKRDWSSMTDMMARLLIERTGEDVAAWNKKIAQENLKDEKSLKSWLTGQGVTGYPRMMLVMERFGYPDFFNSSADELIDGQYTDRPQLRPICDALIAAATGLGEVVVQARKTYISLVTPRRTFARIQPTTKTRVDLGLRLDGHRAEGRLLPAKMDETMRLRIALTSVDEVDEEVLGLLQEAYEQNC